MKNIRLILFVFALYFLGLIVYSGYSFYKKMVYYKNPQTQIVRIEKGTPLRKISYTLDHKKIISSGFAFEMILRIKKQNHLIKAGEYEFTEGLTLFDVMQKMIRGDIVRYKITIPEGWTRKQICSVLSQTFNESESICADLTKNLQDIFPDMPKNADYEGYMVPQTYFYEFQDKMANVIDQMRNQARRLRTKQRFEQARKMGLSWHEVVIMASVVEKETGAPHERPLIAGVFFNRLRIGMPLQSDPTVIYGIKNFNGNLTRADLQTPSPYNTYTEKGLPAGPICNPGDQAIDAVLQPTLSDYYYFVAKGKGEHHFSKTLDEHNNAVNLYQR